MKKIIKIFASFFSKEFIMFAFVGTINTFIHMVVLFILVEYFQIWYMLSSFLAFLIAVTNSFIMNTLWTFKKNIREDTSLKYVKFFSVSIIAAFSNLFFLYIFTEFLKLHYLISQFIAIILTLIINFSGNKFWTFKS